MIETFTKQEFEAALPHSEKFPLKSEGLVQGEWCYTLKINEKARILIRSSIGPDGKSAGTGEDSIRTFLVDNAGRPLGSKVNKYTTRKPGWNNRLKENCRILIRLHWAAGFDSNGEPAKIFKVSKEGPNKGRYFVPETQTTKFQWL